MKPGYKIIIAGLLIYAGFQTKKIMDVAPYKEKASQFIVLLKQNKPFDAQSMLRGRLQSYISIEQIHTIILEQNLSASREISWSDWQKDEEKYTLSGEILFHDSHVTPVRFVLSSSLDKPMMIDMFSIDRSSFNVQEQNSTGFLE